jgi:polar amino acid transport system substrate-binding protein
MKKLLVALLVLAGCASSGPSQEAKTQLAPTGTLRIALLISNPVIATKDAKTGELGGTTAILARSLAADAGLPLKLIDYPAVNRLMEDSGKGVWDLAVVAVDPERRSLVDFAPAHIFADGFLTVLLPPGSTARTMADLDQPGKRVAAVRGAATSMTLQRTLKNATVALAENENAAFALMKDGQAEGYAQNRFMLRARAATLPGSRLLDDSFAGLHLAFALPKDRPAAGAYVGQWLEAAKASGTVQGAIDNAGLAGEVKVAR